MIDTVAELLDSEPSARPTTKRLRPACAMALTIVCGWWSAACCSDCDTPAPVCGDGAVGWEEICDDGNTFQWDDCTNECTWTLQHVNELGPEPGHTGTLFGSTTVAQADVAAIGAPGDNDGAGAVYIYRRSGSAGTVWMRSAIIHPADPGPGDAFGTTIALNDDTLLVGAPSKVGAMPRPGVAYIFERDAINRDEWSQTATLAPIDLQPGDLFGSAVAVKGEIAVVTAVGHAVDTAHTGVAYVFRRNGNTPPTWEWLATLSAPSNPETISSLFGSSIALTTTNLAVAGVESLMGGVNTRYVHTFECNGVIWSYTGSLTSTTEGADDRFGQTLAAQEGYVAVGAPFAEDYRGTVSVFERDSGTPIGWRLATTLRAASEQAWKLFGTALAFEGRWLVVAANTGFEWEPQMVYVFRADGVASSWSQAGTTRATNEAFGHSVAVSEPTLMIGAPLNRNQEGNGSVSVFILPRD